MADSVIKGVEAVALPGIDLADGQRLAHMTGLVLPQFHLVDPRMPVREIRAFYLNLLCCTGLIDQKGEPNRADKLLAIEVEYNPDRIEQIRLAGSTVVCITNSINSEVAVKLATNLRGPNFIAKSYDTLGQANTEYQEWMINFRADMKRPVQDQS